MASNYKEIDGDLIELFKKGEFDVIAHGCNCFATMGAGIALTIGKEFPEAKIADKKLHIPNGPKRLGKLSYTEIDELYEKGIERPKYLFNLYTQFNPGRDFKFNAMRKALREMKNVINYDCYSSLPKEEIRIGLPLIGCGIAGGDWNQVSALIKRELAGFDVTIIHFKQLVEGVNYWKPKEKKIKVNNSGVRTTQLTMDEVDGFDDDIVDYFIQTAGVDISGMTEDELDAFLDTI